MHSLYLWIDAASTGPTPLSFINQPFNQSILQYERVELECFVRSTLTPKFIWKFTRKGLSQLIVDGHNPLTLDYFVKLGERSQVLIIKEAKWIHEGIYQCIVSTDNRTIQAEAKLDVLGKYANVINTNNPFCYSHACTVPASEIDIDGSITINEGLTTFTVVCNVNANPPASIVWFKTSDEEVEELANTSRTSITHQFTSESAPISLSTLIISTTGRNDYMCLADNNVGDAVSLNFSLVKAGQCNCIRTYKGNKCLVEGICMIRNPIILFHVVLYFQYYK